MVLTLSALKRLTQSCRSSYSGGSGGFTLIEVLVVALLMGVGILGLMGLQAKTTQYNHQAYLYTQAMALSQDISERMRANPSVSDNYLVELDNDVAGVSKTLCSTDGECTPEQLAQWDVKTWKEQLSAVLPQGEGAIQKIDNQYHVVIQFYESRDVEVAAGDSVTPKQIVLRVQL